MDISKQPSTTPQPEFIPLPQLGPDPIFGLGRSTYYDLERRGFRCLVRVIKPGNKRGKVLISVPRTREAIRKLGGLPNE